MTIKYLSTTLLHSTLLLSDITYNASLSLQNFGQHMETQLENKIQLEHVLISQYAVTQWINTAYCWKEHFSLSSEKVMMSLEEKPYFTASYFLSGEIQAVTSTDMPPLHMSENSSWLRGWKSSRWALLSWAAWQEMILKARGLYCERAFCRQKWLISNTTCWTFCPPSRFL